MPLRKFRNVILCVFSIAAFILVHINISYAYTILRGGSKGQVVWYNPINGKAVSLSNIWYYKAVIPGLRWKFYGDPEEGRHNFELIIYREIMPSRNIERSFHEFRLRNYYRKVPLCNKLDVGYLVVGNKGEVYEIRQVYPAFKFGEEEVSLTVALVGERDSFNFSERQKIFCPLIESFFEKDSRFSSPENDKWHNPLSGKPFILLPDMQVEVKNIISFESGSYQAYTLTNDSFRVDLIKIRNHPYSVDYRMVEKMDLPEDTVFRWKNTAYRLSDFETDGFTRREARFEGTAAEGRIIEGIAFDYQKHGERILLKVLNLKGGWPDYPFVREWAKQLFDNSIPD